MKRSIQRVAASSALLGGYFYGALHQADQVGESSPLGKYGATFTRSERQQILDIRQKVVQHTGNLANTGFVLLEKKETFDCAGQSLNRDAGPVYVGKCNAVIIGASALNKLQHDYAHGQTGLKALNELVITHEFGHGTQMRNDEWPKAPSGINFQGMQKVEQQADCYAGRTMNVIDPSDIPEIKDILLHFPSEKEDPAHGSPEERAASFMNGAHGKPCIQQ